MRKKLYVIFILFRISQSASRWAESEHWLAFISEAKVLSHSKGGTWCSRGRGQRTFNILISKWTRNLTTGHNEMKSDIYGVHPLALFSRVFNFSYHSNALAGKNERNCRHLVTRLLCRIEVFFTSFHQLPGFIAIYHRHVMTCFLWDKIRNCLSKLCAMTTKRCHE